MADSPPAPAATAADDARQLHVRGAEAAKAGRHAEGLDLLCRAASLDPDNPYVWLDVWRLGRHLARGDAIVDALLNLSRLKPQDLGIWIELAEALNAVGRRADAASAYRQAVKLRPADAKLRSRAAHLAFEAGEHARAEAEAREALRLQPDLVEARVTLAAAIHQQERLEEAMSEYRLALAADPKQPVALANMSDILCRTGHFADAERAARRAIEIAPHDPTCWLNLSAALSREGRPDESLEVIRRTLELAPQNGHAHVNAGMALLTLGRWSEGFAELEWRLRDLPIPQPGRKLWDGSPLNGQPIVLRAEQGFGDTIQFVRYAPMMRDRFGAGRVIVECPAPLRDLMRTATGVDEVTVWGEPPPPVELEVLVMSLPHRFGTTVETVPADVPYLRVDPARAGKFRPYVPGSSGPGRLRVGLVWAGNPKQRDDRRRSTTLDRLEPLFDVPGVSFVSLQKGPAVERDAAVMEKLSLTDLGSRFEDLADMAAAMSLLDLVITVCTAPAHLAGALNIPVWTMLPRVADWRWLLDRSDTPWYPSMRLFRQPAHGDWASVVRDVADALRVHSSAR
jgi:Flp pilus assembly protein TadD